MTTITAEQLERTAVVYVRQSTAFQVSNNLESGRRQYGLVERARQLGWIDVQVIDDDLGRSGGGITRPGFEKLLTAICERRVGAVLSIEASRLARNGRDWHTLLEFCGLVGTLIVDEDGVYDPRSINDRLLLGMKGTMSEMEVSVFRQRSMEAMKQKARRGELFLTVAVGYAKTGDDRIELDPDRRVREAIALVFRKFAELRTVRQVLVWIRRENMLLPAIVQGNGVRPVDWKLPVYHTLHHILTNPVYAGAYVFGRRTARVSIEDGRKRIVRGLRRDPSDWDVLIKHHHEGYISWEEYERNLRLIGDNANGKSYLGRGSIRQGGALLPGLFRCARCGKKLQVSYGGKKSHSQRYACRGAFSERAELSCISFGGMRIDRAVASEILERIQPLGIEAAIAAANTLDGERSDKRRQHENAIEQARFEVARAFRQYDAADPENRLVTADLERRWNDRLVSLRALEDNLAKLDRAVRPGLSAADHEKLMTLGKDLSRAWNNPGVTMETRKKIVRLLISEIVVDVTDNSIVAFIHWHGGDHTQLDVKKNKAGQTRWTTSADVVELVRVLARQMPDTSVAAVLNRSGKVTGRGNGWSRASVCSLRHQKQIPPYREGERTERGEATLDEAAATLKLSRTAVRRLIATGTISARQICPNAPWIVRQADLASSVVHQAAERQRRSRRPQPENPLQKAMEL
jgi:DNA invertase Pin-like site-specific DNA recombinase